ncbi:hypothetical protein ACFP1G_12400 [Levilactobacillus tongjiangensis]|uniref:Transposase n=1 Tax=Levilactobacillus tongjiangensis TaxID=2486023 RepID=A0ABW1SWZ5_9LACO
MMIGMGLGQKSQTLFVFRTYVVATPDKSQLTPLNRDRPAIHDWDYSTNFVGRPA